MLNLIGAIGLNRIGWFLVIFVGVTLITLTFGLQLPHRLLAAQRVLDAADDIFEDNRLDPFPDAVQVVDDIVTGLGTVTTAREEGSIAPEVPQLVAFLSQQTGLTQQQVAAALQENFPHMFGLLTAASVAKDGVPEVSETVSFVANALGVSEEEVVAAVQANFPNIGTLLGKAAAVPGWDMPTQAG